MHLQLEDYRPEPPSLDSAISLREGVILSVALHVVGLLLVLWLPQLAWVREANEAAREAAERRARQMEEQRPTRFVFVAPTPPAPQPNPRVDLSDQDSVARAEAPRTARRSDMPFSRGNTPEPVETARAARPPGERPAPEPGAPERQAENTQAVEPARTADPVLPTARTTERTVAENLPRRTAPVGGGSLSEALQNLQRYVKDQAFENPDGGVQQIGPLQFDTKGVEFGPWVRRFIAQIKRNWFVPYAAMSLKGRVVISFNVHKNGTISDLAVLQPSTVDSFTTAAVNALSASNPTQPLPPEYPSDQAHFTVTFFYNENPGNTPE